MRIRFLGIEIERKTDVLAFAAFLLSLSSIVYQIVVFLTGPQVTLAKPRQVVAYMHAAPDTNERYLTLISTLAYVNSGQSQNSAVVMKESISFTLGERLEPYVYTWHEFVSLKFAAPSLKADNPENRKIELVNLQTAAPFVVPGGGAEAHETLFAARFDKDFIYQKSIVRAFERASMGESFTWKLRFHAETLNDGLKEAECEVIITPRFMEQLTSLKLGWTVLNCK
jgi:hypothetical protein